MIFPIVWLTFIGFLTKSINGQWAYDEGLKLACQQMNGVFKQRQHANSIHGDTCSLKYLTATRDDDEAREFCELYAPWRLNRPERIREGERHFTICHVEATFTCKSSWMQMFGHCFRMPKKHMTYTYKEGKAECQKEGGEIAYMHHRYIPGVWRRYYRGIGQIWVRASESFNQYVQKTNTVDGDALALAFYGKHYEFAVYANSLIRIDPNVRLELLCQYKPQINAAEINYLGRRYSEIYYPAVPVDNGVLIRSASSYTSSSSNLKVCQGTLKPFEISKVETFIPDDNVRDAMLDFHPELLYLTRSGAHHSSLKLDRVNTNTCSVIDAVLQVRTANNTADYFLKNWKGQSECDNMLSTAFRHWETEDYQLTLMSDSRSLPIWCKLGYPIKMKYIKPTNGWIDHVRKNGEAVAHMLFTKEMWPAEAKAECEKIGAKLSGFESHEEGLVLQKLAEQAMVDGKSPNFGYWLGGVRNDFCKTRPDISFEKDPDHPCSIKNVFIWQDGAAIGFEENFWRPETSEPNPNNFQGKSFCLAFAIGNPNWAAPNTTGWLDDVLCDYARRGYYCQKKLTMIEL